MSYIPTNWQTGDVITAEKLNHAESAIGVYYFHFTVEDISAGSGTPQITESIADIITAFNSGKMVYGLNATGLTGQYAVYHLAVANTNNGTNLIFRHYAVQESLSNDEVMLTIANLNLLDLNDETISSWTSTEYTLALASSPSPLV